MSIRIFQQSLFFCQSHRIAVIFFACKAAFGSTFQTEFDFVRHFFDRNDIF